MLKYLPYVTKLVSSGLIHLVNINYLSEMKGGKLSSPFKRLPNLLNGSPKLLRLHAWKSPSLSKTNPGQKSTRQTDLTKNANGGRVGRKRVFFHFPPGRKAQEKPINQNLGFLNSQQFMLIQTQRVTAESHLAAVP